MSDPHRGCYACSSAEDVCATRGAAFVSLRSYYVETRFSAHQLAVEPAGVAVELVVEPAAPQRRVGRALVYSVA